jgi:malonyl-CoA O-methyltransferase
MSVKARIKHAFAKASESYDQSAELQRRVGTELIRRLGVVNENARILDLGSGTGFISQMLIEKSKANAEQIVALDIALPMLKKSRQKLNCSDKVNYLCADGECLPFQEAVFDLVISNLAFQWFHRPELTLRDIKRSLKPNGRLLLSTFGCGTLNELRNAWRFVDQHEHVNRFLALKDMAELLENVGFCDVEIETEQTLSTYVSVMELLSELKQLGAQTVISGQRQQLTLKSSLTKMINCYEPDEQGFIPATYEIIYVSASVQQN